MRIKVSYNYKDEETIIEINKETSIEELLKTLNINKEEVIVKRNDEVALEEEKLKDGDEIKILRVVSGG